jgi:hypothetical protein
MLGSGCGTQANESGSGMFSIFKKKAEETASVVHADVGAPLTRETSFPSTPGLSLEPVAASVTRYSLDGVPPNVTLGPHSGDNSDSAAYVAAATPKLPALAVLKLNTGGRTELWELGAKNELVREVKVRFDPAQDSWTNYFPQDVATLPGGLLLIGMYYRVPRVEEGLFLYDRAAGTIERLVPFATMGRFFNIVRPSADTAVVVYATKVTRLGMEQYYFAPTRVVLFSPRHPRGLNVLELAPKDGSVDRWTVIGRKLWIESTDNRGRGTPARFVWSLDLAKVLP